MGQKGVKDMQTGITGRSIRVVWEDFSTHEHCWVQAPCFLPPQQPVKQDCEALIHKTAANRLSPQNKIRIL